VSDHILFVFSFALHVNLSLPLFVLFPLPPEVIFCLCVFLTAFSDLISELRVFIGNFDLLLQSELLILQFAKAIFHHLGLNLLLLQE